MTTETALIPAEEFSRQLPAGWYVTGFTAEISEGWSFPERRLNVRLDHQTGISVDLEFLSKPDFDWLSLFLKACEGMHPGVRSWGAAKWRYP